MNWLDKAIEIASADQKAVLITVADVKGSSPRESGAKMLILSNGEVGTIGGGALELDAINTARELLNDGKHTSSLKDYPLGPSLEQCCGGFVVLMFEMINKNSAKWLIDWQKALCQTTPLLFETKVGEQDKVISHAAGEKPSCQLVENSLYEYVADDRQALWVFGAGHVTKALVDTLNPLGFAITVVDQRHEFVSSIKNKAVTAIHNNVSCREIENAPSGAMVLVMTHSHAQDFDICHKALLRDDLSFIGLIGSSTKRARFLKRLRDKGLSENKISQLTCPIGIGHIRDKRPEAIAISVAAQLLSLQSQAELKAKQPEQSLFN